MNPDLFRKDLDPERREKAKETIFKCIHVQDYEELMKVDEFTLAQKESEVLKDFKEGQLIFDPTYKYNPNSNVYDTSST